MFQDTEKILGKKWDYWKQFEIFLLRWQIQYHTHVLLLLSWNQKPSVKQALLRNTVFMRAKKLSVFVLQNWGFAWKATVRSSLSQLYIGTQCDFSCSEQSKDALNLLTQSQASLMWCHDAAAAAQVFPLEGEKKETN